MALTSKLIPGYIILVLITAFGACKKDDSPDDSIEVNKINGVVQKGPFINGSSVTLFELNSGGGQTGSSFNTQTTNSFGSFEINNITLATNFVMLKADGYFFDEVQNQNSDSPITLYALTEVNSTSSVNINILTHLEKDRIIFLMNNGLSFDLAKSQVKNELYGIFKFGYPSISTAEQLSIAQTGEENAILLATSLIFRGSTRSVSDFSQLMADFIVDFKNDGDIDNAAVGTELINDARFLNLPEIRLNLETRYTGQQIPDFEKYINRFIDSTDFIFTRIIEYPDIGNPTVNLLSEGNFIYPKCVWPPSNPTVGIYAFLPEHTSLRVQFGNGFMNGSNMNVVYPNSSGGWQCVSNSDVNNLKTVQTGYVSYNTYLCVSEDSATVYIYENGATVPTRIKHIIAQ